MSTSDSTAAPNTWGIRYWPLGQIVIARTREFYREPEALFWAYCFPVIMIIALGVAFREKPIERMVVDVIESPGAESTLSILSARAGVVARIEPAAEAKRRLKVGKTELVVAPAGSSTGVTYLYEPTRPESVLARDRVNAALQESAGRKDPIPVIDEPFTEPGGRYIDFLVPGLLGMGLMAGGLWGVGFITVDMRIRKLLKRFLATPMKRRDFLAGVMISRLLFTIPEVIFVLVFARLFFGVRLQGSLLAMALLLALGAFTFAGMGLLIASRAKTIEAVSGLMNLVMLPMWVMSGIFFSADRFPDSIQPLIRALPLTALLDALRAIMLEGASPMTQLGRVALLAAWGIASFVVALRIFRWQ